MTQTDTPTGTAPAETGDAETNTKGGKGKVAAVAGAGAAVAGLAGGIAVAARDTRRRVLGVPIGRRGRIEKTASTVVDKVGEPVKTKVGSRFARD